MATAFQRAIDVPMSQQTWAKSSRNGRKYKSSVSSQSPSLLGTSEFNGIISQIYDCAMAPAKWEQTLRLICEFANFCCAGIYLLDRQDTRPHIQHSTGIWPVWLKRFDTHKEEFGSEMGRIATNFFSPDADTSPKVLSREVPRSAYADTRYFRKWVRPQGIADMMHLPILRKHDWYGAIMFGRQERWGPIGSDEIAFATLLQPHLHRAMAISERLEVQTLRIERFRKVVENLTAAVILVAQDGAILDTNGAADRMLDEGRFIHNGKGRLQAIGVESQTLLRDVIASAATRTLDATGSNITLQDQQCERITAQILPLLNDERSPHSPKDAVAAIFIAPDADHYTALPKADTLSLVYNLTTAETRVAEALADGKTSLQAAKVLGISEATIRTHLGRIFAKAKVARQTELVALMHRLALPLRGMGVAQQT